MQRAEWLVGILIALAIGVLIGARWGGATLNYFEATDGLNVRLKGADVVGSFSPGTILVSPDPLVGNPDAGWIGCIPVRVGNQAEAVARGIKPTLPRSLYRTGLTVSFDYNLESLE